MLNPKGKDYHEAAMKLGMLIEKMKAVIKIYSDVNFEFAQFIYSKDLEDEMLKSGSLNLYQENFAKIFNALQDDLVHLNNSRNHLIDKSLLQFSKERLN